MPEFGYCPYLYEGLFPGTPTLTTLLIYIINYTTVIQATGSWVKANLTDVGYTQQVDYVSPVLTMLNPCWAMFTLGSGRMYKRRPGNTFGFIYF
ncbi:hypothetical protein [Cernens ardua]|uniref:hypothetical protein n=1 Tax=Cernens ardua TaxID=3402176 RepID=UPI003F9A6824